MTEDIDEVVTRLDERKELIAAVYRTIVTLRSLGDSVLMDLQKLSEMGVATDRSLNRIGRVRDWLYELQQVYQYDIVRGAGKLTKSQRAKGEEYELS